MNIDLDRNIGNNIETANQVLNNLIETRSKVLQKKEILELLDRQIAEVREWITRLIKS